MERRCAIRVLSSKTTLEELTPTLGSESQVSMKQFPLKLRTAIELTCEEFDKLSVLIVKFTLSAASLLLALSLAVHVVHEFLG